MLSRVPGLQKRLRVDRPELPKPKKRLKRSTFATLCAAILLLAVAGVSLITTVVTSRASVHAAPANTAVTTYRANNARTGNFSNETVLNTSNVNSTQFGKRVSYPVDGLVYAEPLYVPNLTINGAQHNVVFVATEHDSIYAFDADQSTAIAPLWHTSFLTAGVSTVATSDVVCNDLVPEIGITGTPTIDTNTNIMYVVVYTKENSGLVYRLHAIDLTTGLDKPGSPIVIQGSVPGTGSNYEAVNGQISFKALKERQRAALTFANGQVYIPFGSFCDNGPYHGWVFGYTYNGTQFTQSAIYNSTPNGAGAGLWGSGGSVATDSAGNLYVNTGNGDFDLNNNGTEAGDSLVKLSPQLQQLDYFSPFNNSCLNSKDTDLGSGGPLVVNDFNEVSFGGKEGRIYVGATGNLGKFTVDPNLNCTTTEPNRTDIDKILYETAPNTVGGIYGSAAYWNGPNGPTLYMAGAGDHARAFSLANGVFTTTPIAQTTDSFSYTGGNLVISSNGNTSGSGIMWTLDPSAVLKAFDASDITKKLYSSTDNAARDSLGSYVKFSLPTVANGEVFVGTQNALVIYGLNPSPAPATTPTPSPTPGVTYDNVGISDDTAPGGGNYDGSNNSYSAQALRSDGINPGDNAFYGHIVFAWPNVVPGQPDNYTAHGQTIPVSPLTNATVVAFAGSATGGPSSGTVTVNYTDGSSQFATLGFSDWHLQGGLSYGNNQMAYMTYYNSPTKSVTADTYLFEAEVTLQLYKTVKSVTLPSTVTGGTMHVFAVTTNQGPPPPAVYNNIATSDDSSPASGNFDGANSYSAQALQAVGITPGGTVTYNGTNFTWPNVASGKQNNYVAKGQLLSITPVSNATTLAFLGAASGGDSSGTATINYSDGTTQDFALGFGDWTATGSTAQVHFGNLVVAQTAYRNTPKGQQTTSQPVVLYTEIALQPGKTIQSVVLPSVINGGQMHIFAASTKGGTAVTPTPTPTVTPTPTPVPAATPTPTPTPAPAATPTPTPTAVTGATPTPTPTTTPAVYNNKGTSDDSAPSTGNFDGTNSYSAEALQAAGITPGKTITYNGVTFTWPTPAAGTMNNYRAKGQTLAVTPVGGATATTLAFLGAASGGKSSGTATITYTDGTTQTFTLGFSDWTLGSGTDSPSFGNLIVATATYRNTPTGPQTRNVMVFYTDVSLQFGKTLQSVTFPATLTGGWLHVFSVGTKAAATPAVYNNIGTSDDGAPSSGNFDGTNSYSAQALQAVGITPGGTVAFNGVNFTWPSAASGSANNYVANGQQVPVSPVSGATTLAFLGSASAGNSSGTAVITYTDGTTQAFTLGFNDWTLGGSGTDPVAYGDLVVATTAYRNTPTGPQTAHQPVILYADVALQAGKTIQSVTLPTTVTGGQLHVFAVSTK